MISKRQDKKEKRLKEKERKETVFDRITGLTGLVRKEQKRKDKTRQVLTAKHAEYAKLKKRPDRNRTRSNQCSVISNQLKQSFRPRLDAGYLTGQAGLTGFN